MSRSPDDYFEAKPMTNEVLLKQHGAAVSALRQQHDALVAALRTFSQPPESGIALPTVNSFDPSRPVSTYASRSSAAFHRSTPSRASSFSINSGEDEDFYDAVPGEFVLEEEDVSSEEEEEEESQAESSSAPEVSDDQSSVDTEVEDEKSAGGSDADVGTVQRRSKLPAPAGEEFSMLSLLRKNVGKVSHRSFYAKASTDLSCTLTGPFRHLLPCDDERASLRPPAHHRGARIQRSVGSSGGC